MTSVQSSRVTTNSRSNRNDKPVQTKLSSPSSSITTIEEDDTMKRSAPAIIEPDDGPTERETKETIKSKSKKKNGKKTRPVESKKNIPISEIDSTKKTVPPTPLPSSTIGKSQIVTPSTVSSDSSDDKENISVVQKKNRSTTTARRSLLSPLREISQSKDENTSEKDKDNRETLSKETTKRNAFGHARTSEETVLKSTRKVYSLVSKMTGSIGGNGHGGAIYGELTIGSMQKMVDLMKKYTDLNETSRFIDVGCGLGKPNIHVAQDPKVEFSYGIEMEHVRWMLGMTNLNEVMKAKSKQLKSKKETPQQERLGHRCYLAYGDITEASYFDPFTHVYMFDIGFPPTLFKKLSNMFNQSQSPYLICYHGPKLMIERYEFDVELLVQMPTSMHGSAEGHMGYIYKRVPSKKKASHKMCDNGGHDLPDDVPCDKLFADAWRQVRGDFQTYSEKVQQDVLTNLSSGRPRRTCKPVNNDPYISSTLSSQ